MAYNCAAIVQLSIHPLGRTIILDVTHRKHNFGRLDGLERFVISKFLYVSTM